MAFSLRAVKFHYSLERFALATGLLAFQFVWLLLLLSLYHFTIITIHIIINHSHNKFEE
jgi:hypothetical protein